MHLPATSAAPANPGGGLLARFHLPDGQPYSLAMLLCAAQLIVAFAGDLFRYTIGWSGYGILVGLLLCASIVLFARRRPKLKLRHLPPMLLAVLAVCLASTVWSEYRIETLVASLVQLSTAFAGLTMAVALTRMQFLRALSAAMRLLVYGSLAFELAVALFAPGGILPPSYLRPGVLEGLLGTNMVPNPLPASYYWTHAELFTGGPLQGLMGNRNLFAIVALLALVTTVLELLDRMISPWRALIALTASVLGILLTQSATVYVALAFVGLAAVLVFFGRRIHRRLRWLLYSVVGCVLVVGATLVVRYNDEVFALMNRSSDMSGRGVIWRHVLNFGAEKPLLGHGWISYWAPWLPQFRTLGEIDGVAYYQAHNAFIDVWMQVGTVGLVLFAALVFSTLIRTWWIAIDTANVKRVRWFGCERNAHHLAAATAAPFLLMVALVVQSMTESRLLVEGPWLLLSYFAIYARLRVQDVTVLPRRLGAPHTGPIPIVLDTRSEA